MPEIKLIDLPVTRACIVKWNRGKAAHGEEFEGDPLEELFGELIDGINYADQAELEGFDMSEIRAALWNAAHDVQRLADNRITADELATEHPERKCRVCGCTDDDCRQCIAKTGRPCHWVADDLCSACADKPEGVRKNKRICRICGLPGDGEDHDYFPRDLRICFWIADDLCSDCVFKASADPSHEVQALLARHAESAAHLEVPGGACD